MAAQDETGDAAPFDWTGSGPQWNESIVATLTEFVAIPALSPNFDPDWSRHGKLLAAAHLLTDWARRHAPEDATVELLTPPGRTPLLLIDAPGEPGPTTLVYGHFDKQPEMDGWQVSGPWQPRLDGDRLYGRGGADDGYAVFVALEALRQLRARGDHRHRCVILIEGSEESGSPDLGDYLAQLADQIRGIDFVICLDSGCGDYDRLWSTLSLRGLVSGMLRARVLEHAVHSGDATGMVPSSFRVLRALLERIECAETGTIKLASCSVEPPPAFNAAIDDAATKLASPATARQPLAGTTQPVHGDNTSLLRARGWDPGLEIIAADGLPVPAGAGNVMRPETGMGISLRLPPTVCATTVADELEQLLTQSPPYAADVRFERGWCADGWYHPRPAEWLVTACDAASQRWFGKSAGNWAEGVTVPFMRMLQSAYPNAEFLVTGVLGPGSNAHGPNEFLHLPTAQRLVGAVADTLVAHWARANAATA